MHTGRVGSRIELLREGESFISMHFPRAGNFIVHMEEIRSADRVHRTIRHEITDRIPRGELIVEEAFLNKLYPNEAGLPYMEKLMHLAQDAKLDIITIRVERGCAEEALREITGLAISTDYFVMALVDGLFWREGDPVSFEDFILGILKGDEGVKELIERKKEIAIQLIKRCLDNGAHGVIIGDDIAYNRGPFLSPEYLRKWIFSGLQEIVNEIRKARSIAFLHSCGNIEAVLDLVISSGFNGLHGMAPSAGNDPFRIHERTKKRITLMGIIEVDLLEPEKIKTLKNDLLLAISDEGGYIMGSAEGLSVNTPLESFRALYL